MSLARLEKALEEKRSALAESVMARGFDAKEYLIAVGTYRALTTVVQMIQELRTASAESDDAPDPPAPAARKPIRKPRPWGGK